MQKVTLEGNGYPVEWKVFVDGKDIVKDLTLIQMEFIFSGEGHRVKLIHVDEEKSWVDTIENPLIEFIGTDEHGLFQDNVTYPCPYYEYLCEEHDKQEQTEDIKA